MVNKKKYSGDMQLEINNIMNIDNADQNVILSISYGIINV